MMWPWSKKSCSPSAEALAANLVSEKELITARAMRQEAHEVGQSIQVSHDVNHYAIALAAAISGGKIKP